METKITNPNRGPAIKRPSLKVRTALMLVAVGTLTSCTTTEVTGIPKPQYCQFNTDNTLHPGEAEYIFNGTLVVEGKVESQIIERPLLRFNAEGAIADVLFGDEAKHDDNTLRLRSLGKESLKSADWYMDVTAAIKPPDGCLDKTAEELRQGIFTTAVVSERVGFAPREGGWHASIAHTAVGQVGAQDVVYNTDLTEVLRNMIPMPMRVQ